MIPAFVQYAKTGPLTVSISAKGVIGEERVDEERVHVKRVSRVGDVLQAEVVALLLGRLELETEYQNVLHTYYLPEAFQKLYGESHVLCTQQVWIRNIYDCSYAHSEKNISQRVKRLVTHA